MVKLDEKTNLKELIAIYLAFHHFLPLIKKLRYKSILIRTDNIIVMYNINRKWKIWKLSEINCLQLKVVYILGKINVATDRLSRVEMSRDYHLKEKIFQMIQWKWRCFPKVDLFASKLNRLVKTYTSVIPRKDPNNIGIGLVKNKNPILLHPPIPLIFKVLQKFRKKGKIDILIVPSWKGQV
jgi:hypothetical protein